MWFKNVNFLQVNTWCIEKELTWFVIEIGAHSPSEVLSIIFIYKLINEIILALTHLPIIEIENVLSYCALYAHFFNPIIFDV